MKNPARGFTLVEVAIVLIIIGLLLAGILKGQEMVTQARIKRVVTDIGSVTAAVYAYHDRYGVLPGDDREAARWAGAIPGNGNAMIEGGYASATATDESRLLWDHLRRAGFLVGGGDENPLNSVAGKIGVQTGDGAGGGVLGMAANTALFTGHMVCTANLPAKVAEAVDFQMDDGLGKTGGLRAKIGMGNPTLVTNQAADDYVEGVGLYVLCRLLYH